MTNNLPKDLTKLRTDDPPKDRQFLAWAVDTRIITRLTQANVVPFLRHVSVAGLVPDDELSYARWCPTQWNHQYKYWEWSVPGYAASVKIYGWIELPWNDFYADAMLMDKGDA